MQQSASNCTQFANKGVPFAAAGQLAFDAALPAVRVAVLEGLQLLVDNQHAQPVLKVHEIHGAVVSFCTGAAQLQHVCCHCNPFHFSLVACCMLFLL